MHETALAERHTVANYSEYEADQRGQRFDRGWVTWFAGALAIAALAAFSSTPSGYIVQRPGPVYDTLGTTEIEGDPVSVVDIPMMETFPTTGSLAMTTVTAVGDRENTANWLTVAGAWLDRSQRILTIDEVYPRGVTSAQQAEISQAQMTASQQGAIAAALTFLSEDYETIVSIVSAFDDGPAAGLLEAGDVVEAVNAVEVTDLESLRGSLDENGTGKPAILTINRDGASQNIEITPIDGENGVVIGVEVTATYDFPFEVLVQLEDVGGPSAGQIFALAIIDKLTPGSLTGGTDVAGTGTIAQNGSIGAIGGITQKMHGAVRDGADYFLAPTANCDEVVGNIPEGLSVFAVSTLADSVSVLNTLSTGASTAHLPRC